MQPRRGDVGLAVMLHRELAEMTLIQLSQQSGVSDRTISDWKTKAKSGRRPPTQKLVEQVAAALGLTFADLHATATYIADLRVKAEAAIATPKQLSLVEERSEFGSLSKAELIMQLGHAHERQLTIEAELETRRRTEYHQPT